MISLRQSLSIADSHDIAAAIAHRNYIAAVDLTPLQPTLSAIACRDFTAADMISLLQSLSAADSNYFTAAVACSSYVAAVDLTSLPHRCQPLLAATSPQ